MSTLYEYDVIISGAGPAGSTAGYLLSKAGLKVLIIDKAEFPRQKLCAGLITYKTVKLLERVFGESVTSLKERNIINYEAKSYEILSRSKPILQRDITIPFRFIERERYDHFLLKKAAEAGAHVISGDGVTSLNIMKSMVTLKSGKSFSAEIIIGADGVNSRIRRSFLVDLFGRDDWSDNVAACFEMFIDRKSGDAGPDHPVLSFGFVDWGYAWIFPNKDKLKVGICALKNKNPESILSAFRNFLSESGLNVSKEDKLMSYVLPYGCFLPEPVFKNIILVGDAAGFADPLLGEGIYFAQRSGELAAQSILKICDKNKPLKMSSDEIRDSYMKLLNVHIYPELIYAGKIRDVLFKYLSRFNYTPLKLLMGLMGDKPIETVHGLRSYRWMKKMKDF